MRFGLDDREPHTLKEIGEALSLTRERVRQVEVTGLSKMRGKSDEYEMDSFLGWEPGQDSMG